MFTIGILQCGRAPEELIERHGDYDTMFQRLLGFDGFAFTPYAVLDGVFPAHVHAADGWLITGSRFAVYEDHPWIAPLEDFLREAYALGVPIVGVCFGHQILAQALGGTVEKYAGGWSVGQIAYALMHGDPLRLAAFHQDQVTRPPSGATVTGSAVRCRYAFLRYGERAMSMQPHPEFSDAYLRDLMAARADILPDAVLRMAAASTPRLGDTSRIAETIRDFFTMLRGAAGQDG